MDRVGRIATLVLLLSWNNILKLSCFCLLLEIKLDVFSPDKGYFPWWYSVFAVCRGIYTKLLSANEGDVMNERLDFSILIDLDHFYSLIGDNCH